MQWAQHECKRRGQSVTDWNVVRNILNESRVMKNIRFLTMSAEEFARVVSQTSISPAGNGESGGSENGSGGGGDATSFLTQNEQIGVFMNLAIPGIVPVHKALSQETAPRCAPRKLAWRCSIFVN